MSDLFIRPIIVELTREERDEFVKLDAKTRGGPQDLYRDLLELLGDELVLALPDSLALRVYRYAYEYGKGGYQAAFRIIVRALTRAGWTPSGSNVERRPDQKGRRWDGGGE